MDSIKVGPVGGRSGLIWEEKGDELAGIFVSYDEETVDSLQFLNYVNGKLDMSAKYGIREGEMYCAIILDYPSEFITSISGSFDHVNKNSTKTFLSSIKFGTNKGSYGPFGTPSTDGNNIDFNFVIGNHQFFGGFHGTKTSYGIESIGFYLKDIPSSVIKLKDSPVQVKKEK